MRQVLIAAGLLLLALSVFLMGTVGATLMWLKGRYDFIPMTLAGMIGWAWAGLWPQYQFFWTTLEQVHKESKRK